MRRGRLPAGPLRSVVRSRGSTYSLDRLGPDTADGAETAPDYDTDAASALIAFGLPSKQTEQFPTGEVSAGTLVGLALPDADVAVDDRFTYNNTRYEVDTISGMPDDESPEILQLQCQTVQI